MADDGPTYSDDEAEAIFRRAFEEQAAEDGFERDELVHAAQELGLDEAAIDRALAGIAADRAEADVRATVQKRQRERWQRHLFAFVLLVGGALALSAAGLVGTWPIVMALIWGTFMALHTFDVMRGPGERALKHERRKRAQRDKREAKRLAREAARAERQREREAQEAPALAAKELERAVDEGVALLLSQAANKLREVRERAEAPPADTEFNRFVARKKAGEPTTAPQTKPAARRPRAAKVRVAVEEEPANDEAAEQESRQRRRRKKR